MLYFTVKPTVLILRFTKQSPSIWIENTNKWRGIRTRTSRLKRPRSKQVIRRVQDKQLVSCVVDQRSNAIGKRIKNDAEDVSSLTASVYGLPIIQVVKRALKSGLQLSAIDLTYG